MRAISVIEDQASIKKILQHLGIWETFNSKKSHSRHTGNPPQTCPRIPFLLPPGPQYPLHMTLNRFALRFQAHPPSELHNMPYCVLLDIQSGFRHVPTRKKQFPIPIP